MLVAAIVVLAVVLAIVVPVIMPCYMFWWPFPLLLCIVVSAVLVVVAILSPSESLLRSSPGYCSLAVLLYTTPKYLCTSAGYSIRASCGVNRNLRTVISSKEAMYGFTAAAIKERIPMDTRANSRRGLLFCKSSSRQRGIAQLKEKIADFGKHRPLFASA
jgi:hypothetical protein